MIDNIFSEEIELFEKVEREFDYTDIVTRESYTVKHVFYILDTKGDYALLYHTQSVVFPFIVVYLLDKETGIWEQGHYFEKRTQAIKYFNKELDI